MAQVADVNSFFKLLLEKGSENYRNNNNVVII